MTLSGDAPVIPIEGCRFPAQRLPQGAVLHELHDQDRPAFLDASSHVQDDVGALHLPEGCDLQDEACLCFWVICMSHRLDGNILDAMIPALVHLFTQSTPWHGLSPSQDGCILVLVLTLLSQCMLRQEHS